jgi:hypothetical protein
MICPCASQQRSHFVRDERAITQALERPADDLFAMAEAIDRRGVDPVDAEIERLADGADRRVVVPAVPN